MIERETRYLVHGSVVPKLPLGDEIAQGYVVANADIAVRVRRRGPIADTGAGFVAGSSESVSHGEAVRWTMTVKALLRASDTSSEAAPPPGSERREVEVSIGCDQALELWEMCGQRVITKTRHLVPIGDGLFAEVDVFSGRWSGLVMVEVEFDDRTQMENFVPPPWFGREVTADPRFTNASLALCSTPEEADLLQIIQAECGTGA